MIWTIFLMGWLLLSLPIALLINSEINRNEHPQVNSTIAALIVFGHALFNVPRFYIITIKQIFKNKL